MNPGDIDEAIESNVGECQAKLDLVNDYLERFKIMDNRILSPIKDIERCIHIMVLLLQHHDGGDALPGVVRK